MFLGNDQLIKFVKYKKEKEKKVNTFMEVNLQGVKKFFGFLG